MTTVPVCTQTDFHETTRDDDLHNLRTQFLEFKRYAFDELAVLRSKKYTNDNEDNYLKPLLRSMEHRIISLERQLENKQRVIEKLIAGPEQIHPEVNTAPVGISEQSGNETKEKKLPQKKNEIKRKTEVSETSNKANGKKVTNNKCTENKSLESNSNKDDNQVASKDSVKERKIFVVVGDSMLNNIEGRGLAKKHNVTVRANPGATTRDILDHIKPALRKKPDHSGHA